MFSNSSLRVMFSIDPTPILQRPSNASIQHPTDLKNIPRAWEAAQISNMEHARGCISLQKPFPLKKMHTQSGRLECNAHADIDLDNKKHFDQILQPIDGFDVRTRVFSALRSVPIT